MRSAVVSVAAAILSACHTPSNGVCPALIEYNSTFNRQLADEILDLPADSAVVRAVRDYISLRDQIRACLQSG
jgi:hypothetical protein